MVGGEEKAFARARPLFEALGKTYPGRWPRRRPDAKIADQIIVGADNRGGGGGFPVHRKGRRRYRQGAGSADGGLRRSRILEVHGERMVNRASTPAPHLRTARI